MLWRFSLSQFLGNIGSGSISFFQCKIYLKREGCILWHNWGKALHWFGGLSSNFREPFNLLTLSTLRLTFILFPLFSLQFLWYWQKEFIRAFMARWWERTPSHYCDPDSIPGSGVACGLRFLLVLVLALRVFSLGHPFTKANVLNSNSTWKQWTRRVTSRNVLH